MTNQKTIVIEASKEEYSIDEIRAKCMPIKKEHNLQIGSFYRNKRLNSTYVLCQVGPKLYCLVNKCSGQRYSDATLGNIETAFGNCIDDFELVS